MRPLMLALIRLIKVNFIILLNTILNHLLVADHQQNRAAFCERTFEVGSFAL